MAEFTPLSVTFRGCLSVAAPLARTFPLFSPEGERSWVPGWNPELLYPHKARWEQGQIFRTQEEQGEAVWIITRLHWETHTVEYHRVEAGRFVARIDVRCCSTGESTSQVLTAYTFIGLCESGNREIATMTQAAYDEKMGRWAQWICAHLKESSH